MYFALPKKAIGLDIGSYAVKAVQMSRSGGRLFVEESAFVPVDRSQFSADPASAQGVAVRQALQELNVPKSMIVGGLPGQTVVIRYPRIPDTPRDQLDSVVQREAANNIPYDLSEVFLDWTLLDEIEEDGKRQLKMLIVAAKHEIIQTRMQIAGIAGIDYGILGVDSLALADGAEQADLLRVGETVALVNIGLSSASIHFVKDGISNFIRDVNWGARELVQALMKEYRCDNDQAEKYLIASAEEEAYSEEPMEQQAAVEEAEPDPFAGESGGASLLEPLEDELGEPESLGGGPPAGGRSEPGQPPKPHQIRQVLTSPMGRLVSEIRRSFDYYEHQLYERPVDRLILSGGVAHIPILGETLIEELGVDSVEVADPVNSALVMGDEISTASMREHPAQFLVAVGLAARGMAQL